MTTMLDTYLPPGNTAKATRSADGTERHGTDYRTDGGNASAQETDLQRNPIEVLACWIAAEHAMEHIRRQLPSISKVFQTKKIPRSAYCILAGFDNSLIKSGSYLEQIHIFVADVRVSSRLRSELGKLCSPFPAILFTDSRRYELPIFKDDGSILDIRKLDPQTTTSAKLKMADAGSPGKPPLSVVSCAMTPDMHNITTESDPHERCGNGAKRGEGGGNREEFPGAARLSFEMDSEIYPADNAQNPFEVAVLGELTIETTPTVLNPSQQCAERCVSFNQLDFCADPDQGDIAYNHDYIRIDVHSDHTADIVDEVHPTRPSYNSKDIVPSSLGSCCARMKNALLSMFPGVHDLDAQQDKQQTTIGEESLSRQTTREFQKEGVRVNISVIDNLPSVRFKYIRHNDDVPEPPFTNTDVTIMSFWSMLNSEVNKKTKWVRNLLADQQKHPTAYSNLVHVVFLNPTLSPRVPTNQAPRYIADLTVKQPSLTEHTEIMDDSGTIDHAKRIPLSTLGDIQLSRQCNMGKWIYTPLIR